ncbi:MAG: AsmA family protein [Alphaproteobacteria bacterium]
MFGRLLLALVFIVLLLVAAAIIIPMFIPVEVYRTQIKNVFKDATGRDLTLDGDLSLSLLPPLSVRVTDVKVANAAWGKADYLASIDEVSVGLEVMPLLTSQKVKVSRFILGNPSINLEVGRDGAQNWVFETSGGSDAQPVAQTQAQTGDGSATVSLNDVSLGDVRLVNGRVSYTDATTGETQTAENINVSISLPSLDGPLGLDGSVTYNGEALDLRASVAAPRDLIEGRMSDVDMALTSDPVNLSFDGTAASQQTGALPVATSGQLDLDIPSIRALSAWAGSPMPDGEGFGPLKVKGTAKGEGNVLAFNGATIRVDEMNGEGDFQLNIGGARPKFTGRLTLDQIDTRPYETASPDDPQTGPADGEQPAEFEGWSDEPIDLSGLKAVDADIRITTGAVTTSTLKMGKSDVTLTLVNGLLTVDLKELALYEGAGALFLEVDARNQTPAIKNRVRFNLIQAQPLLKDLMGSDMLEGVGTVELDITTRGRSQKAMMSAVNGTGSILFNDGAIYGINLAEIVRQPAKALANVTINMGKEDLTDTGRKTDFAEMAATLVIENGVLKTDDFRLLNPFVRILGAGTTSLATQAVDFRIDPKAVATKKGQGGEAQTDGIGVPIKIGGTWGKLSFSPDLAGVGRSVLERNLPGDAGKLLSDPSQLLKGGQKEGEEGDNPTSPADAIQGLFGKKKKEEKPKNPE